MKHIFKPAFLLTILLAAGVCTATADDNIKRKTYQNPVLPHSTPDPTIIKCEEDGFFYLYGTEDTHNMPIYRSRNLIDWIFVGTAFTEASRPKCVGPGTGESGNQSAGMWAPDINYINGQYVLYYGIGVWGQGNIKSGVAVATSDRPEGPFIDRGVILTPATQGVNNSIDQFFIEDNGRNYLIWGSFAGIYMIELTDDGLRIKPGAQKVQIAGTFMEGSYVFKRDGYYYLFGSNGSCCEGANSTYQVIYGRSDKLEGPYVTKSGGRMLDNQAETLLTGDDFVAGPGHNAEFVVDDNGDTWIPYHGYLRDNDGLGRVVFIDKVMWRDGWPYMENNHPTRISEAPYFKDL